MVGAGPVGLLLVCELQRLGVDHLLIEKVPKRSYFCKALGVTPRTLKIFEALGVAEQASGATAFDNGVETEWKPSRRRHLSKGCRTASWRSRNMRIKGSWKPAFMAMAAPCNAAWR